MVNSNSLSKISASVCRSFSGASSELFFFTRPVSAPSISLDNFEEFDEPGATFGEFIVDDVSEEPVEEKLDVAV